MIEFTPLSGITLGEFTINSHGVFIVLGIILAYIIFSKRTDDKQLLGIKDELLTVLVISGLIGARLVYVLTNLDIYSANPLDILKFWKGGVSLTGGIVLATVSSYIYLRKKNINFFKAADSLVIPVTAGMIIGRIGDILSWDHPGTFSNLPWAFVVGGQSQHPVIIYEMLGLTIILGVLFIISKKKMFQCNMIFAYLGMYGLLRFFTDAFRLEQAYFGLRLAQIIGLSLLVVSILILVLIHLKSRKK